MTIKMKADIREVVGKKVKQFRKQDLVPAVAYGHDVEPKNLWVNLIELERVYAKAGESAIIELDVKGQKVNALIHDIQLDPMTGKFSHIDFFQVQMDEEVETEIPLEFIGESAAVKAMGGILIKNMDTVPVKCLPADLPQNFEVDLSKIATFDDHITIADLKVSNKVAIALENEAVIALVTPPRTEAEMASLDQKVQEDVTKVAGVVKEGEGTEKK